MQYTFSLFDGDDYMIRMISVSKCEEFATLTSYDRTAGPGASGYGLRSLSLCFD